MAGGRLTFKPVTTANLADFEALFEGPGGPKYCWCMVFRITSQEGRNTPGKERKPFMVNRIKAGTPVGLIGSDAENVPRAWVSIAPKETYLRLGGPEPRSGERVWSLACMYVQRKWRGQGLAHELIAAAVAHAFDQGADVVEAYPVPSDAPSYRFMGFVEAFEAAGFEHHGMAGKRRHVMRRLGENNQK